MMSIYMSMEGVHCSLIYRIEFSLLVREPVNNSYSRYWGMRVVRTYKDD